MCLKENDASGLSRRNLHSAYMRMIQGNYSLSGLVGFQMFQKTVGIIGTGAIGVEAVRILRVRTRGEVIPSSIARRRNEQYMSSSSSITS